MSGAGRGGKDAERIIPDSHSDFLSLNFFKRVSGASKRWAKAGGAQGRQWGCRGPELNSDVGDSGLSSVQ